MGSNPSRRAKLEINMIYDGDVMTVTMGANYNIAPVVDLFAEKIKVRPDTRFYIKRADESKISIGWCYKDSNLKNANTLFTLTTIKVIIAELVKELNHTLVDNPFKYSDGADVPAYLFELGDGFDSKLIITPHWLFASK